MRGEPLTEREDVPRLGAPPAVDELVVVRYAADVASGSGEECDQEALGLVGVLILVDQQPLPALAVEREPVRMLGQQPHRDA